MTDYKVAWASVGLPTGKYHRLTKEPLTVSYNKGETVDSTRFDSEEWNAKLERLVEAGGLVEPGQEDEPNPAYRSAFDVPLTGGSGETEVQLVTDQANDDLDAEDEGDDSDPAAGATVTDPATGVVSRPETTESTVETAEESNGPSASAEEPAKPNVNASGAVWHQYAEQVGVQVAPDAKRADVIQAVEAAGK